MADAPCPYCGTGPCLEPMPMIPGTTARQHPGCYALKRDTETSVQRSQAGAISVASGTVTLVSPAPQPTRSKTELVRSVAAGAVPLLRPCPFCGGEARIFEFEECAVAQCLDVKAHRLFVDGDNTAAQQVADLWNQRAGEAR